MPCYLTNDESYNNASPDNVTAIKMKARINTLITSISENMYEREHIIALSLLAGIAGANTFLYGTPGTAKSLISRRIASAFEISSYFEYLMHRFSTPEELFGPISLKALKQDQYIRKTEHYLPCADFVFLDEIWKASPAILNTLLTLVNEKSFKNGGIVQQVPLKVLICASNEVPEPNQGLDALYDRFVLRLNVEPISKLENFHAFIQAKPSETKVQVAEDMLIRNHEIVQWRAEIHQVVIPHLILKVFDEIRRRLKQSYEEYSVYVSDRRWQRVAYLVKAAAFLNERDRVVLSDLLILKDCLWSQPDDRAFVGNIVDQSILDIGLDDDLNLNDLMTDKDGLEQEILNQFFYTDDVYESYLIQKKEYLRAVTNLDHHYKDKLLFLMLDKMGTKKDFFAIDQNGHEIRGIVCNFNGTRQCTLKGGYYGHEEVVTPYIKHTKGTSRTNISESRQAELLARVDHLKLKLEKAYAMLSARYAEQVDQFHSAFVLEQDTKLLSQQIQQQIEHYQLQIQDVARLAALCHSNHYA